jgi:DNA repair protein RecO (recombination protein O)
VISSIVQTEALVLRNIRFGDTSRVATLFTRELGKIGVMGKGVRDPKSPFGASLEILTHSSFILYYRPGRELQFLKSGWVEKEFRGLLQDPRRYSWGCACAEFLDRMLMEEEPAEELFSLALRAMEVIESAPRGSVGELFRAWQLRVAAHLGYAPRVDHCLACGRPLDEGPNDSEPWLFLPAEGGVLCPACRSTSENAVGLKLPPRALRRIRAMIRGGKGGMASPIAAASVREPSAGWLQTLDRLVEEFLRYHVDSYRGLRSLEGMPAWESLLGREVSP